MIKVLIAGNWEDDEIATYAVEPFREYQARFLSEGYSVALEPANSLAAVSQALENHAPDIAIIATSWSYSAQETTDYFQQLREQHPQLRIVYLDTFDQSSTPFFGILPFVDKYVKKQLYKDLSEYRKDYRGGYVFSDFVSRKYNIDPGDFNFGSYLPESLEHKLMIGWNVATFRDIRRFFNFSRYARWVPIRKTIDINCRVGMGDEKDSWYYYRHRVESLKILEGMRNRYRVVTNLNDARRMGFKKFIYELAQSRIGFSPFGWGEITYRDFYAIACDVLLIKPDISHLNTYPDIFRAGETYVATRWDLSDVEEKCSYYLEHPKEASEIIRNAREALGAFYRDDQDYSLALGVLKSVTTPTPRHAPLRTQKDETATA